MESLDKILAKSQNYGSLTLLQHTEQVTEAIQKFALHFAYPFDVELARKGAVLHDLGKAHPHFQGKIRAINGATLIEKNEWDFVHRHEISSLAFLPLFPQSEWKLLIDLVIGHHKSIENDAGSKGILDLDQNDRHWMENHLKDWENWQEYGLAVVGHFGFPVRKIPLPEAQQALAYVVDYCETKRTGWSPYRGLLKSADHFASAFMHQTGKKLKPLFEVPDLTFYRQAQRRRSIYPLSEISTDDSRKHTLVVAPTGAGKTDFLLRRCLGRVFYTLPFQASINAMYERIRDAVPNQDIRLLHATSRIVANHRLDEQILQPLAGSSVKVLTPHQLAATVFGTSGFESVMLDVQGTDVILDEIHTYSDYSRAMVLDIVKALLRLDCRLHIGTATMPSVLYNELLDILGGKEVVYEVKLAEAILDSFNRHQVYKLPDESEIPSLLSRAFENKEKVLVIYNTISKAQAAFLDFIEAFPNVPKMLIHSRFRRGDRVELEKKLKTAFNGDGSEEFGEGLSPCLVIATQVVEVSLDISFDRIITQCAPLDSLIQRFGRVNRRRNEETIGRYKPVHVIAPEGNVLPYKLQVLQDSFAQLPDGGELLHERALQTKIDAVYPALDRKDIDTHLIFKNGKYNGKYTIKELTNYRKAVLVEALEIESATCILESDRDAYLTAGWEERLHMEIPINYKTIAAHKSGYEQLEVGAYPFVVPQDLAEYRTFGLQLVEHNNFI